jgi:hypothetical protein
MNTPAAEREQALRWLIAHRRPDVSIEQTVRLMCAVLPRDLTTMQLLRRIAEEQDTNEPSRRFNSLMSRGLPLRE